jgi:cyclopropane fatty-acyl-phospholipid synthase-like methyltransferase
MSTYILMKILEFTPHRYDKGIFMLTLGSVEKAYNYLTTNIKKGQNVLDIGCGTGALTLRAAQKGAKVKGIDINSQMLENAGKRIAKANLEQNVELCEMGLAELGIEENKKYDIVMSGLCFSELTEDELNYTLNTVKKILKPEGLLLLADEVNPNSIFPKIIHWLIRSPLVIITYIVTQTTTHAIKNLPEKVEKAGFKIVSIKSNRLENFITLIAKNQY